MAETDIKINFDGNFNKVIPKAGVCYVVRDESSTHKAEFEIRFYLKRLEDKSYTMFCREALYHKQLGRTLRHLQWEREVKVLDSRYAPNYTKTL
jgi:hypothetical protein